MDPRRFRSLSPRRLSFSQPVKAPTAETTNLRQPGDTALITSNATMNTNEYHQQAEAFLTAHGIKCRITRSNTKPAPWGDDKGERNHYRVTLSKSRKGPGLGARLVFDFWGSINDFNNDVDPVAYDVLACISSDANCPSTFADYCAEFGEDSDSIKALQTFRRTSTFAKRLQAFFTADELTALADIQ